MSFVLVLSLERRDFNETRNFGHFFRHFNQNEVSLFLRGKLWQTSVLRQAVRADNRDRIKIDRKKKKKRHVKVLYRLLNKVGLASNGLLWTVDRPFITTCMRFLSDHSLLRNSSICTGQRVTHEAAFINFFLLWNVIYKWQMFRAKFRSSH